VSVSALLADPSVAAAHCPLRHQRLVSKATVVTEVRDALRRGTTSRAALGHELGVVSSGGDEAQRCSKVEGATAEVVSGDRTRSDKGRSGWDRTGQRRRWGRGSG